jgi:hypothetical protein
LALAAIGFIRVARRGPGGVLVSFPLMYAAALLVWPNFQGVRFLLPVLPLYVLFIVRGVQWLFMASSNLRMAAAAAAAVLVGFFYVNFYTHAYYGPIGNGAFDPTAQELFAFVRQQTPSNSVFIFFKPRALALFTDRQASAYFSPEQATELIDYFRQINASYVAIGPQDTDWSNRYILPDTAHFERVWSNADFSVFQVRLNV